MEEVMKDFLETYAHAIRAAVAIVVIGCLFYLGSTMNPEEEFIAPEPIIEVKIEPIAEPEPVVEVDPVIEVVDEIIEPEATPEPEIVIEMVEVEENTVITDTVEYIIEIEDDSLKAPVEVEVDSTHTNHMVTEHPEVTVSVDGYLIVPDSVDNIVNAFVYAVERVGRNTYFVWRDSTFTTENFYDNTRRMNN
jgi:uncharacterized ferredoxin-like protein